MKAKTAVRMLYAGAAVITAMGVLLCVAGFVFKLHVSAMNNSIPVAIFGAVIAFLGVRYWRSVGVLASDLRENPSEFSWQNFASKRFE